MAELKVEIPEDISEEFSKISEIDWQLLFSKFLKNKLDKIREIESIVSKSNASEEHVRELAEEVSLSITKRLIKS